MLLQLPPELLVLACEHVEEADRLSLGLVCRTVNRASTPSAF